MLGAGARNWGNHEVLKLLVVFEMDEDGWEVASCPTLPGCHSQGRTRKEALDNIREAIRGYLASLREHDAGDSGPPFPAAARRRATADYSSSSTITWMLRRTPAAAGAS